MLLPVCNFGVVNGLPSQSIDFESSSSQYLSMSDANFGSYDRAKWTVAGCFKMESVGVTQGIFSQADGADVERGAIQIYMTSANKFRVDTRIASGGAINGNLITTSSFSSTTTFYKFMIWYDSANATPGDRLRMWLWDVGAPTEITSFAGDDNPTAAVFDSTAAVVWGALKDNGASPFDGLQYYCQFYSGVNVPVTDIFDATTGLPLYVGEISGLKSALDVSGGDVTSDSVLVTPWTNNGGAVASSTIPT